MTASAFGSLYSVGEEFAALQELHDKALQTLPATVADFLESGAGTESTLRSNRLAFEQHVIKPRPMSGVADPDLTTDFLGAALSAPLVSAPFGGDKLFHEDGHLAVARAAESTGVAMVVPEAGSHSYETVIKVAPSAARIAQLHPAGDFDRVVERVSAAGYSALCVTVDCPVSGYRVKNRINRFDPGMDAFAGNVIGDDVPSVAEMFGRPGEGPIDWSLLAKATQDHGLPWIAKGILGVESAEAAIQAGAAAIIVSNHGGRQLDPAPASLSKLPLVAAAVNGRVPVVFDSGVRTGSDVFLALALGADLVMLGRTIAYGLAAGGEAGVRRTIELITEELRTLMILAGVSSVQDFDPSFVELR